MTLMPAAARNEVMHAFRVETGKLVDALGDQLVALEAHPRDDELLNAMLRGFHTIKGSADFLGVQPMVELSHHAEGLLDAARQHRVELQRTHIDCLLRVLDALDAMVHTLRHADTVAPAPPELMDELRRLLPGDDVAPRPTSRIDDTEFEALLDQIHGKGGAPGKSHPAHAHTPHIAAAAPHTTAAPTHIAETSIRVDTARIDALINATGELVRVRNRLSDLVTHGDKEHMARAMNELDRVANDLQKTALGMRMQPVSQLFQRFPRVVRDAAHRLGKQVVLDQRGGNTMLDRTLVGSLSDTLVHLLRNAIDHGIEDPQARARAGKPAQGTITLSADQRGECVVITVSDDGRGMDPQALRAAAVARGLMTDRQARALTPAECHALVFRPGLSTSNAVSDISGRGVGMDVVKTNVAALGGTVGIESTPGIGTSIHIGIPLTPTPPMRQVA